MAKSDFLGGLLKNPSVLALAGLGIVLFVFRDKITNFTSGITGGAKTVSNLGQTGNILSENLLGSVEGIQDIFSGKIFENFKFPELPKLDFNFEFPSFDNIFKTQPIEQGADITETPAAVGRASDRGRTTGSTNQQIFDNLHTTENFNVQTGLDDNQQFQGGGLSFIGGSVSEIPIDRLSLGQIIDRFNVTASQAADIRARALDDFGDFDFGTNTGGGSSIDEISNVGAVSDSNFSGLTPQQIMERILGGNINNF